MHLEKKDLQSYLDQAARSCRLTETLMNHIEELCLVPTDLMTQLRHNNELYQCRLKENNNPVSVLVDLWYIEFSATHKRQFHLVK